MDGQRVPVAAQIGIDTITRVISPLHTHDQTGIVHIEADAPSEFTLGQFFTEWAVRLTSDCVGGYCKPNVPWRVVVNGHDFTDDPTSIGLHAHDEIAIVIGRPPADVPATFEFPQNF